MVVGIWRVETYSVFWTAPVKEGLWTMRGTCLSSKL